MKNLFTILIILSFCSLAIAQKTKVAAWGDSYYGQINLPNNLVSVIDIAASESHSMALKSDGSVIAWGADFSGQITIPTNLNSVTSIAIGSSHSMAL
jgi:Regulator of chromosome condensation (RCC1) repeat